MIWTAIPLSDLHPGMVICSAGGRRWEVLEASEPLIRVRDLATGQVEESRKWREYYSVMVENITAWLQNSRCIF